MTMFVSLVMPLTAYVAADTVTWGYDGRAVHLSKLRIIAAARTVIVTRGDHAIQTAVADEADKLSTFDAITAAAPEIAESAYRRLPQRRGRVEGERDAYEVLIVGHSDRIGRMHGTFLSGNAEGSSRQEMPPTNSGLAPWSREVLGPKPVESLCQPGAITAAARRQAAWLRSLYPGVQIGGDLVLATITPHSVTVETIARDI